MKQLCEEISRLGGKDKAPRLHKLMACLGGSAPRSRIDLSVLASVASKGLPTGQPAVRAVVWKLFLGYLDLDPMQWDEALLKARGEYSVFVEDLMRECAMAGENLVKPGAQDGSDGAAPWLRAAKLDIDFDVSRLWPSDTFFREEIKTASEHQVVVRDAGASQWTNVLEPLCRRDVLARILLLYAMLNPGVRYVQGMHELLAILYYLFASDEVHGRHSEADAFYCFSRLMDGMRDYFLKDLDASHEGLSWRVGQIGLLLKDKDPAVFEHLESEGVGLMLFVNRWIMCMCALEVGVPDIYTLWDCLLASGPKQPMLDYVCVAMILRVREVLLAGDLGDCLNVLKRYPPFIVSETLSLASGLAQGKTDCRRSKAREKGALIWHKLRSFAVDE